MKRLAISRLVIAIHSLMENKEYKTIEFLLEDTKHGDPDKALCLLRSSFSERDNYIDAWNIQLEYAKEFWPERITQEDILRGLL